jgi:hypothetical protein
MLVSAGHLSSTSRAEEVPVALLVPLVPLSCDVLVSLMLTSPAIPALSSAGPGVVGEAAGASGTHNGLYKNRFESESYCKAL